MMNTIVMEKKMTNTIQIINGKNMSDICLYKLY